MRQEFSVSLMCMDFLNIEKQMNILNERVSMYHVDIMDGHFCENITLSPDFIKSISKIAKIPIDVHLMTTIPEDWIETCAKNGATYISPHSETINTKAFRIINMIENLGCKVGIVLNPATPLSYIESYIARIDMLTIMSVDVGFSGQPFIEEMIQKIKMAAKLKKENGYKYIIQVDGACNNKTFRKLKQAGAEKFVVGKSGLFSLDENLEKACEYAYKNFDEI